VQLLDLSHVVEGGMITYPGLPGPVISDHMTFEDSRANYAAGTEFQIGRIEMVANTGTYLDTPAHRWEGRDDLSTLPLERLAGLPGVAIRSKGPELTPDLIADTDVSGAAVLFNTGWDRHWRTDDYGSEDHPFVGAALAEALVAANLALVGIDSVNIDSTIGQDRPAHSLLLGAGILVVEHLTRLDRLPDDGFEFFAVPVKVRGMGTFPVRAFARWS
jgi:kynurenine formamidase